VRLTFVEAVLEIFHVLQLLVGGYLAVERIHFFAEFGPDIGALGHFEPQVGEETGGGVAACEEDVQQLRAYLYGIGCLLDELVQENVAASGCLLFLDIVGAAVFQGRVDVAVCEVVDDLFVLIVLWVPDEPGHPAQSAMSSHGFSAIVESFGKAIRRVCFGARGEAESRASKQEFGGGVNSQAKEQVLEVYCGSISWNGID
jgi:hypothetical protein